MAILSLDDYFSFIIFFDFHLVIGPSQIQLCKLFCMAYAIERFINK